MMAVRPIRSDQDLAVALQAIERLWNATPGTDEADELDVLSTLADAYERQRWPDEPLDAVDAIKGHMDLNGLNQADLGDVLESQPRASEILNRKRALTLEQIRKIENAWKLPATYLIGTYDLKVEKVPKGTGRPKQATQRSAAAKMRA